MSLFKNIIKHNKEPNHFINNLTGIQFEHYTGRLLKALGFNHVIVTKPTQDGGTDVMGTINDIKVGIQCKHLKASCKVPYRAVEEANAGKSFYNLDKAIVLTNARFTKFARYGAKQLRVELWDGHDLRILNSYANKFYLTHSFNPHNQQALYLGNTKKLENVCNLLASAKAVKIVLQIICDMHPRSNKVKCSYRKLSRQCHVSTTTVSKTLQILQKFNLAKVHDGYIFLSPLVARRTEMKNYSNIYNNYYHDPDNWWLDLKHIVQSSLN